MLYCPGLVAEDILMVGSKLKSSLYMTTSIEAVLATEQNLLLIMD